MDAERFAASALPLYERVSRTITAMYDDASLAEESAQEALLRAWERVDRGEEFSSLEAWTMTVALNWSRSQLRRRGTERRALVRLSGRSRAGQGTSPVEEALERGGIAADGPAHEVREAVLALPRRQREVVVLHYLADHSISEVAEITGRSPGAVRNALFHARSKLAEALDQHRDPQEA